MTMVEALVLERQGKLQLRDIDLEQRVGAGEVKIKVHTVGICASDVHYYTHGRIGPFEVKAPMVLGHEAAGTVVELGEGVTDLKPGDRVCMEPGIPDLNSRAARLGLYNVDPAVRFWATPPVHGCLTRHVVHPANFTFKLPDNVSFAEGAMVEPFAVGMHACMKANIKPGDIGVVIGAGPIGIMTAIAAVASGCAKVIVADLMPEKLAIAAQFAGIETVNILETPLTDAVNAKTNGWGADVVLECSGAAKAYENLMTLPRPGGKCVLVGLPVVPVPVDISAASTREIEIVTIFRYAHVYDRAIAMFASGKVDLKPLISETFRFEDCVAAFDRAAEGRASDVKLQIQIDA